MIFQGASSPISPRFRSRKTGLWIYGMRQFQPDSSVYEVCVGGKTSSKREENEQERRGILVQARQRGRVLKRREVARGEGGYIECKYEGDRVGHVRSSGRQAESKLAEQTETAGAENGRREGKWQPRAAKQAGAASKSRSLLAFALLLLRLGNQLGVAKAASVAETLRAIWTFTPFW